MKKISLLLLISIFISSCALQHKKLEPKDSENTECNAHLDTLFSKLDKVQDEKVTDNFYIQYKFPKDKKSQREMINEFDPLKLASLKKDLKFLTALHNNNSEYIMKNLSYCEPKKLAEIYFAGMHFVSQKNNDEKLREILLEKLLKGLKVRTNASRSFLENIIAIRILKLGTETNLFLNQKEKILDIDLRIQQDVINNMQRDLEEEFYHSQMFALEIHDILMRL